MKTTPTCRRPRPPSSPEELQAKSTLNTEVSDIWQSIHSRLTSLDGRIFLLEVLHKEFQVLRDSLEFTHELIIELAKENKSLHHAVNNLTSQLTSITKEHRQMKETMLDLQARSTRDNIVFSSIPESPSEDPEKTEQDRLITKLKLPLHAAKDPGPSTPAP